MNAGDERSTSVWMDIDVAPQASSLKGDMDADTVIVGTGIAGLSTAYELAQAGQRVVVLDRGKIGRGMTARTTAHLNANNDDGARMMVERRGLDLARMFYQSQSAAITRIEAIQKKEDIACDFRRLDGFLFPSPKTGPSELDKEQEASKQVGIPVESVTGLRLRGLERTRALRFPDQATFHPTKYLRGLVKAIEGSGGKLFADTAVNGTEEKDGKVVISTVSGAKVRAKHAVIATNSPINDKFALHSKEAPYRSYVIGLELPEGALPDALYWDMMDPYHYVRLQKGSGNDTLIVGGADHKSGQVDDAKYRFEALEAWIRNLVPSLGVVTHRWSGQVLETIDYSSFTGRNPGSENVYVHTGDSGQGITHGVVASLIISSAIVKGSALWQELYAPDRKTMSAIGTFVSENLTALKNFAEYVAPGEVSSFDGVKKGHGAIVRHGLKKVAAYRDEKGQLHTRSAACTHLGCHLHWNSFERCWDCPCHGSHFGIDGEIFNGPAITPLEEIKID